MPTTFTAPSGDTFHIWQLPDMSSPEPEDSISFTTLTNDLSDGYRTSILFGSNTGVREWKLTLPTLAHLDVLPNTVTDINGATVSREQYLRSLYAHNKTTGEPFIYPDPNNNYQNYLVDFADDALTMQRMRVKIFSTGITLRQRRLPGVTVFDMTKVPTIGYGYDWFNETSHGSGVWTNKAPGGNSLTAAGDVVFSSNAQNGLNTVRFSGTANTGVLTGAILDDPTFEIFIAMKMREAAFSNNAGILTSTTGDRLLVGTSAGTKFQNLQTATYYKNGIEYLTTDRQAPMNEWGVVQVRILDGSWDPGGNTQIGKDAATAGTFAETDIGEIVGFGAPVPRSISNEIVEHFITKWGVV